jgi:sensor histidine kinase YesM
MEISIHGVNMIIAFAGFLLSFYGVLQIIIVARFEPEARRVAIWVFVCLSMLCLASAVAMVFRGKPGNGVHSIMVVANYGEFVLTAMLIDAIARVIRAYIDRTEQSERVFRLIRTTMVFQVILITVNLFTGDIYAVGSNNVGFRNDLYVLAYVLPTLMIALCFVFRVTRKRELTRNQIIVFDLCFMLLILAEFLQLKVHGFNLTLLTAIVCTTLFYILLLEEQRRRYEEQIRQTTLINERLISGQLEPHFINNTLVMIRTLCEPGSDAYRAISNLSEFVGGSLKALKSTEPIPVEYELMIVERYLDIQNQRFENSIEVLWDIEDEDFNIPAFSIQLAVENAIKHGIRMRPDGRGTLDIRTYETLTSHVARIENDGVGFDPATVRDGTGLSSLRLRVEQLCGGSVDIDSAPDSNTVVTIRIPKNRKDKRS